MDNRTMTKKTKKGKITIDRERCKGCHICVEICPNEMIEVDETPNKKGYSPARFKENISKGEKGCIACQQCATVCPEVAIEVYRAQ
jgi:2-oxoglutarate ferredoxin oxidoreductase subunit delta